MKRQLAELWGSERYDQEHEVHLEANHLWSTQGGPEIIKILGPEMCSSLINDPGNGTEHSLNKFAGDTELGGVMDTPKVVLPFR